MLIQYEALYFYLKKIAHYYALTNIIQILLHFFDFSLTFDFSNP